jgi:hypothetical protein
MKSAIPRLAGIALLGAMSLVLPATASATITPPCSGSGQAASGNVDLTTATEWHLKTTDEVVGQGSTTIPMKTASVSAYAFGGIAIPIASASGTGATEGSVNSVLVSSYAFLGSRFYVAGVASGDGGSCSGSIVIIIDDVNPVVTVLGGGALAVLVIGLIGILLGTRLTPTIGNRVFVAIIGLLGGIAAALAAGQLGILDPTQPVGLVLPLLGLVAGFGLCGTMRQKDLTPAA